MANEKVLAELYAELDVKYDMDYYPRPAPYEEIYNKTYLKMKRELTEPTMTGSYRATDKSREPNTHI